MIRRTKGGNYIPKWRDRLAKGRAKKRAERPKRDILMVQSALATLKLRYCQEVSFWNPRHTGKHGDLNGGLQWVDFVARGKHPFVIILDDPSKRWKDYEKTYHANKLAGIEQRNIPCLVLPDRHSSQEYQILIFRYMKRNNL